MSPLVDIDVLSARISNKTVWTFIRAVDSDGFCGWGEATFPGEHAAVHAHAARLKASFIGQPAHPLSGPCVATSTSEAAAVSAIDQAICDISAQRMAKTLADALGPRRRSTIELYANINRG